MPLFPLADTSRAGALNAATGSGFNQAVDLLSTPFRCDTADTATVELFPESDTAVANTLGTAWVLVIC